MEIARRVLALGWNAKRAVMVEKRLASKASMWNLLSFAPIIGDVIRLSPDDPITAFEKAIENSHRWSTIQLLPGNYYIHGSVTIDKPLCIEGMGRRPSTDLPIEAESDEIALYSIIRGGSIEMPCKNDRTCENTLLHNLEAYNFEGVFCSGGCPTISSCILTVYNVCVRVTGSSNVTIKDSFLCGLHFGDGGIYVAEHGNVHVVNSHFEDMERFAVHVRGHGHCRLDKCKLKMIPAEWREENVPFQYCDILPPATLQVL